SVASRRCASARSTISSRCSGSTGFARKSSAPSFIAATASWMLPNAVITITGSSGSASLAARSTPKPSPSVRRRSDSTTAGWLATSAASASGWSRASTTVCPCASSAWRSIVRRESLSSTMRIGGSADGRERAVIPRRYSGWRYDSRKSSEPAGRDAGPARFLFEVGDRFLTLFDALLQPRQLADRLLPVALHDRALRRIVAVDEVGGQRVDAGLHRVG